MPQEENLKTGSVEPKVRRSFDILGRDVFVVGKGAVRPATALLSLMFIAGSAAMFFWNVSQEIGSFQSEQMTTLRPSSVKAEKEDSGNVAKGSPKETDQVLIKYRKGVSKDFQESFVGKHDFTEKKEIGKIGVKVMKIPAGKNVRDVVTRIKNEDSDIVEFAEVDMRVPLAYIPNDPSYASQWHHPKIGDPAAWESSKGQGVTIAVLDTGVDSAHPDLSVRTDAGWNTYDNNSNTADVHGHGTWVSGTAAAVGDNTIGVAGVSFQSKIMAIRISDPSGYGLWSDMAEGIVYAADHGARVANISYDNSCGAATIVSAADYLRSKGGVLVVAAGNTGADTGIAASSSVTCVSATDSADNRASWSSYGVATDLAAPGVGILTTSNGGGYGSVSGTSFSAPTTAGIYGLIFAVNPGLSPADADDILFSTVDDLGAAGWDTYYGWGRVNAAKAVAKAKNYVPTSDTIAPTAPTGLTASALSATSVSLSWGASNDLKGVSGYRVYRDGNEIAQVTFGTAYTDTKVVAQTTYVYTVKAYDTSNNLSSSSNAATVTTPVQPFAVMTVGTSNQTASSANINWTTSAPSTGVVKYGTSQGALTLTAADMVSGTSHQVVVSGLKRKTKYYFQVEATSEDGTKKAVSAIQTFMTRNR